MFYSIFIKTIYGYVTNNLVESYSTNRIQSFCTDVKKSKHLFTESFKFQIYFKKQYIPGLYVLDVYKFLLCLDK